MKSGDKAYPDSFPIASGAPDPVAGSIAHLLQLLDRPIAFHRCFVTLTGSVTAALMLSQAIYWQRRCKDPEGWWYKTRDDWAEETGLSRREQETARKRLRGLGVMQEHLRGVPATIWYRVNEERLLEGLTGVAQYKASNAVPVGAKPPNKLGGNVPTGWAETYQLDGRKPPNKLARFAPTFNEQRLHRDYTETTTTTPNPSSSSERTAEPEPARGGGGAQDPTPEDQDGDHGVATLETTEERPVAREEAQTAVATEARGDTPTENPQTVTGAEAPNERRPELAYPAKLTEREREDIAAQVEPLPAEVAQQMLDVVEAKIGAGQIRTSPAAVLRGIARKYRQDPASFDPSPGFRIGDARRRREEAEKLVQRALEARGPCPAPCPLPPPQNGPRARPEGLKALLRAVRLPA